MISNELLNKVAQVNQCDVYFLRFDKEQKLNEDSFNSGLDALTYMEKVFRGTLTYTIRPTGTTTGILIDKKDNDRWKK